MSTVDLTKVAGFKAVDAEGNDLGIVSLQDMTNMVKESIVQEAVAMQSVSTLAETSTLAATDTYEDKLDISDTFSYVRTLDSSGNPKRTSQNALATVVGVLLSPASDTKKGLLTNNLFKTLNCLSLSWGVSGGGVKTWHKIAKYYLATYNPIQISMFYGYYNGEKTKYDISLTWSNDKHGITGSANNLLGYVQDGDTVTLYVVSTALQSVSAIIIGGSIVSSEQSDQTEEPSGIVYIP